MHPIHRALLLATLALTVAACDPQLVDKLEERVATEAHDSSGKVVSTAPANDPREAAAGSC